MSSLTGLLDTARSALLAHQRAIQLTGNNIANVHTEGYSRQRLDLRTRTGSGNLGIGAGVEPVGIRRLRMESFDRGYRTERSGLGSANMRDLQMAGLEAVVGEPGFPGIGEALDEFFVAWSDLSNEPAEDSYRRALVESAHQLTQRFNQLSGQLTSQRLDMNLDVQRIGASLNMKAAEIAELNAAIAQSELGGGLASDLRDRRDLLVDELAELTDLQASEDDQGVYRVWIGGRSIVDGVHHSDVETTFTQQGDGPVTVTLRWADNQRELRVNSGELQGVLDVRDRVLPDRLADLDQMANALAREVNALHHQGYDLNGASGLDFFQGAGAGGIEVRNLYFEQPGRIAASLDGGSGNGDLAARIADLAEAGLGELGGNSLTEAWSQLVARTGAERRSAEDSLAAQQAFVSNLDGRRQAISGVSLDEELTLMMQQEQAYAAAARVVSVADELITTVLQLVS